MNTNMFSVSVTFVIFSIAALTTFGVPSVYAQTYEQDIEEVLVTARKREESLMEIPVSIAVIDNDFIEAANLNSVEDIAFVTPGFKVNSAFGRQGDRPVIRGVSGISTGVELAGYFVDGVYVSGTLQSFDLDSIERVEVLKGPQSAAFGRRTFAGAINYVTQLPGEETRVKLKTELGSNAHQVLAATVSGQEGIWGYRANLRNYSYDGDFDNSLAIGPQDIGSEESLSFNGTLYITPSATTSIRINALYADDDDGQYAIALQPSSENNCFFPEPAGQPYYCGELQGDTPISLGGFLPDEQYGVQQERFRSYVRLDHDFGSLELNSITAYNTNNYYAGQDQSFAGLQTAFSFVTFGQVPATDWHSINASETDSFSQEVWLRGLALDERLNWSGGVYYFTEESEDVQTNGFRNDISNIAYMGAVDYAFNDAFSAGLELRFAEDDIEQKPGGSSDVFSETFDSLTYRLTGSWFMNEDSMLYGSVSTGTLPGSFNTNTALPADLIPVDEGELQQIEIGVKSTVNDQFEYTAALYQQEWKDQIRSQFIIIDGTPESYQANQGTTDFTGFELSSTWRPLEQLSLTGSLSLNDSEVNDFISTDATDIAITGDGDVSGAQLPLSPKREYYASATYDLPLGDGGYNLSSRLDWSYQDSRFVRLPNQAETGAASVLNLNFLLTSDSNWRVSLWGKNLTDEDAPVSGLRYIEADSFFFGGRAFAITPRRGTEFGITGIFEF